MNRRLNRLFSVVPTMSRSGVSDLSKTATFMLISGLPYSRPASHRAEWLAKPYPLSAKTVSRGRSLWQRDRRYPRKGPSTRLYRSRRTPVELLEPGNAVGLRAGIRDPDENREKNEETRFSILASCPKKRQSSTRRSVPSALDIVIPDFLVEVCTVNAKQSGGL